MTDGFFTGSNLPYLHTRSRTFGRVDGSLLTRTFELTARRLRSRLLRLVDDLASRRIDVSRFTLTANQVIRTEFGIAYSLGALSVDPFHVLTQNDIRAIDREISQEQDFLRAFARDIRGRRLTLDPLTRASLYMRALRGMFELGRLNALPNGPYEWVLGPTEHCGPCIEASLGGPYRRRLETHSELPVLPGIPGSGDLCNGLTRCGCFIRLQNIALDTTVQQEIRDVLVQVIHDTS